MKSNCCRHGRHGCWGVADDCWPKADVLHIETELFRNLTKHLLSEVAFPDSLVEPYELDDVASGWPPVVICQQLIVAIQLLHQLELFAFTDANDNNTSGKH